MLHLDDRTFIVAFDDAGEVRSIKERKVYEPGRPWQAIYNAPYWHHSAKVGGPKTMPARIIAAAQARRQPVSSPLPIRGAT